LVFHSSTIFLACLFFSLHVSGDYVPIIRRNNCIYATFGTCYYVWMTVCMQGAYQTVIHKHNKKNCAPSWLYLQDSEPLMKSYFTDC